MLERHILPLTYSLFSNNCQKNNIFKKLLENKKDKKFVILSKKLPIWYSEAPSIVDNFQSCFPNTMIINK